MSVIVFVLLLVLGSGVGVVLFGFEYMCCFWDLVYLLMMVKVLLGEYYVSW